MDYELSPGSPGLRRRSTPQKTLSNEGVDFKFGQVPSTAIKSSKDKDQNQNTMEHSVVGSVAKSPEAIADNLTVSPTRDPDTDFAFKWPWTTAVIIAILSLRFTVWLIGRLLFSQ